MTASQIPRRVRDIMTRSVKTVTPSTHVTEAYSMMLEGGFRHLGVLEGGKVVGIVSDRDILKHMPPPSRLSAPDAGRFVNSEVRALMTAPALTVRGEELIETATDLMLSEHIGALLVTDVERNLQGIVTLVDVARLASWLIRSLPS